VPHTHLETLVFHWVTSLAGRWPVADRFVAMVANSDLFEAVPYVAVLVAFWVSRASPASRGQEERRWVVHGFAAAALAVLVSRVLQLSVTTVRPVWDPVHGTLFPAEFRRLMDPTDHSFPSDHVAFLLPLALATYRLHRGLGVVAGAWLVAISLARVYLGLHYPIDLLGGALIGMLAIGALAPSMTGLVPRLEQAIAQAQQRWPRLSAAGLFVLAYQYATLFEPVRDLGRRGVRLGRMLGFW
jgi:membrane-associated phospholipid phosphatase